MKQTRGICVSVGVVVLTLADEIYLYVYIYIAYLTEPSFKNISNEFYIYIYIYIYTHIVKHWFFSVPQRISLTSQQLFVSHTIRQTEIPALVGSWVKNTVSVKILCPQKMFFLYFRKHITCFSVSLLRIGQVPSASVKLRVVDYENFCLMNDVIHKHWHMDTFCQISPPKFNSF